MKILVVKSFDPNLRSEDDEKEFWRHGFAQNKIKDVDFYDYDNQISRNLIQFNKLTHHYMDESFFDVFRKAEQKLLGFMNEKKYDLIVFLKGEFVRKELLEKVRRLQPSAKLINIFPDNPLFYFYTFKAIPFYDHFFLKDSYVLGELKKVGYKNCHYLPQACSSKYHFYIDPKNLTERERIKFSSDISIIGSIYPQRQKMLENLRGQDLKIWGKAIWDSVDKDSWILTKHQKELAIYDNKCKIISCSKINLNTHNFQNDIFGCNKRLFEINGCGGFQLVDYKKDMDKLFKIGKEIVVFKSEKELKEKLQYYLDNEKERMKIAQAGYKRAQKDHTYANRIKEVLKILR